MLRVVRTTRSTMSDRFSGDIEQELHETLRRNRLKRARAQSIAEFFDDEELEEINRGRGRHSFSALLFRRRLRGTRASIVARNIF